MARPLLIKQSAIVNKPSVTPREIVNILEQVTRIPRGLWDNCMFCGEKVSRGLPDNSHKKSCGQMMAWNILHGVKNG